MSHLDCQWVLMFRGCHVPVGLRRENVGLGPSSYLTNSSRFSFFLPCVADGCGLFSGSTIDVHRVFSWVLWLKWVWLIGYVEQPDVGWNYYKEPIEHVVACVKALCTFYHVSENFPQFWTRIPLPSPLWVGDCTVCLGSRNKSPRAHDSLLKNASDQKKLLG